ncbi:MAG: hypothetical protein HYV77_00790 [Candidatus Wildermuthbacteria bacterium]|nr:hypothetical protein [Candidatus Wildermuthbacteria bacterium]
MKEKLQDFNNIDVRETEIWFQDLLKKEQVSSFALSHQEKEAGREFLLRLIEDSSFSQKPFSLAWVFGSVPRRLAFASFCIALVLQAGGMAMANKALPGEPLYMVKVTVNESLRSAFMFSLEDKAYWEADRIDKRFQEAERLLVKNKLNDRKTVQIIEGYINQHADALFTLGEKLEKKEGRFDETAAAFAQAVGALEVHGNILAVLDKQMPESPLESLISTVDTHQTALEKEYNRIHHDYAVTESSSQESIATLKNATDSAMLEAEEKLSSANAFLAAYEKNSTSEKTAAQKARAYALQAEELIQHGKGKFEAIETYHEACDDFHAAQKDAYKAYAFIRTVSALEEEGFATSNILIEI